MSWEGRIGEAAPTSSDAAAAWQEVMKRSSENERRLHLYALPPLRKFEKDLDKRSESICSRPHWSSLSMDVMIATSIGSMWQPEQCIDCGRSVGEGTIRCSDCQRNFERNKRTGWVIVGIGVILVVIMIVLGVLTTE
jgi:predicted nucleic acid-binding Zn ribbon protein